MPCGVTKSSAFGTVTCDNATANPHGGTQHSGVLSTFYAGLTNVRLYWGGSDAHPAYRRNLVVGDKA